MKGFRSQRLNITYPKRWLHTEAKRAFKAGNRFDANLGSFSTISKMEEYDVMTCFFAPSADDDDDDDDGDNVLCLMLDVGCFFSFRDLLSFKRAWNRECEIVFE